MYQKPAAANDYTANTSSVNESNYAALPKLQREIMELVAKDDTDEGMHVSAVSRGVSGMGQYSGDKVMWVEFSLWFLELSLLDCPSFSLILILSSLLSTPFVMFENSIMDSWRYREAIEFLMTEGSLYSTIDDLVRIPLIVSVRANV
jgi:hypothetical protein